MTTTRHTIVARNIQRRQLQSGVWFYVRRQNESGAWGWQGRWRSLADARRARDGFETAAANIRAGLETPAQAVSRQAARQLIGIFIPADPSARQQVQPAEGSALDEYQRSQRAAGIASNTIRQKTLKINRIARYAKPQIRTVGDLPACSAKVAAVLEAWIDQGMAKVTVNHHRSAWNAFMAWLVKNDRLLQHPTARRLPTGPRTAEKRYPVRAMTEAEAASLLTSLLPASPQSRDPSDLLRLQRRALYATALFTGLRIATVVRLRWSWIDLASGRISIPAQTTDDRGAALATLKTGKTHQCPIHPTLHQILTHYQSLGPMPDHRNPNAPRNDRHAGDCLFACKPLAKTWQLDLKRADIAYKTDAGCLPIRAFRHTFTTWLSRRGVAPTLLAHLRGDADLKQVMTYYHADTTDAEKAIQSIDI